MRPITRITTLAAAGATWVFPADHPGDPGGWHFAGYGERPGNYSAIPMPSCRWNALEHKQALSSPVAAEGLLSSNRDCYRFNRSLTPPPCIEGVRWLVMKESVDCSEVIKDDGLAERVGFEPTWGG